MATMCFVAESMPALQFTVTSDGRIGEQFIDSLIMEISSKGGFPFYVLFPTIAIRISS